MARAAFKKKKRRKKKKKRQKKRRKKRRKKKRKKRKKKKTLFTSQSDLNLRKKLVKCNIWSTALYGADTWTFREVDKKYLESF